MEFQFIIGKDGFLSDIKVKNDGGSPEAAQKVVEILCFCPRWKPATVHGKPVNIMFNMPIIINLL